MQARGPNASAIAGATRVRVQIFPLLADLSRLQTLCDKVFNEVVPPSVGIFRPALPLVFCGVLHYPDMGGELPWVTGSLSQNEIYFLVPLERYRRVGDREEFVELGATTPFIFVDNGESMVTGRERLGMPKEAAVFSTGGDLPAGRLDQQRLLRIRAWEPGVAGHRLGTLLELTHSRRALWEIGARDDDLKLPAFDPMGPLEWLKVVDAVKELGARTFGAPAVESVVQRIQTYWRLAQTSQTLTLFHVRQFPDPERLGLARYEDLVAFRIRVSDLQSVGFLGDGPGISQFHLRLRRSEIRPIAKVLGLHISQRSSELTSDGAEFFETASALAPVFAQTDVDFVSADRLCWRSAPHESAPWQLPDGAPITPPVARRYTTFLGPSGAVFLEKQSESQVHDARYLMIPASRAALQRRLDLLIPRGAPVRVRPLGTGSVAGVRVLVSKSRPLPIYEQEDVVWNDGYYLSISAPVAVEMGRRSFVANFMFQGFTTNTFMVQSYRELLGEPTTHAAFEAGEAGWFGSTRDFARVLGVSTLAIDRSSTRAAFATEPLLDIITTSTPDALLPRGVEEGSLDRLRSEVWPTISKIQPMISVGHIAWPDSPDANGLLQRIVVTHYDQPRPDDVAPLRDRARVQHVIRIHETETLPICRGLGLLPLAETAPLVTSIRQDGARGRTHIIPVVGYGETSQRVGLSRFEVLWESAPATEMATATATRTTSGGRRG